MKKIFILGLALGLLWTGKAYSCAAYQAALKDAQAAVNTAAKAMCGPSDEASMKDTTKTGLYSRSLKRCLPSTPASLNGGSWGSYKAECFFNRDTNISCLWLGLNRDYWWITNRNKEHSTSLEPAAADSCATIFCASNHGFLSLAWNTSDEELDEPIGKYRIEHWIGVVGGRPTDDIRMGNCQSYCSSYWSQLASVKAAYEALDAVMGSKDQLCATDPECNDECQCTKKQGTYMNNACICEALTGTELEACICTKGKKWSWISGKCYPKGSPNIPAGYNEDTTGGVSSANNNNSNSNDNSGTGAGAGTSGLGGFGNGSGSGSDGKGGVGSSSGSWYDKLKNSLGTGSASTSSSSKFGASGKGTTSGMPGGAGNGVTNKTKPVQGFADTKEDLFTLVHEVHKDQYANGNVGDPGLNSTKPLKKEGTQPIIYR